MLLTLTLVGGAFLLGLLFGAGITIAGAKPERALTEEAMLKLVESHIQVQALIEATEELARLNHAQMVLAARDRVPMILVTPPTGGKAN